MLGRHRRWSWLPLLVVSLMICLLSVGAAVKLSRQCEMAAACPCSRTASTPQDGHPVAGRRSCCAPGESSAATAWVATAPEVEDVSPPAGLWVRIEPAPAVRARLDHSRLRAPRGPPLYLSNRTLLL